MKKYYLFILTLSASVAMVSSCGNDEDDLIPVDNDHNFDFPVYCVKDISKRYSQEKIMYELNNQPAVLQKHYSDICWEMIHENNPELVRESRVCDYEVYRWSEYALSGEPILLDTPFEHVNDYLRKVLAVSKKDLKKFGIPEGTKDVYISARVTNIAQWCESLEMDPLFLSSPGYNVLEVNQYLPVEVWPWYPFEIKAYITNIKVRK